ncbi:MAG: DinB family protein [Anaerolineaceae bacterium]
MPIVRPLADEFDPYYARYIEQVGVGDVLELLEEQGRRTVSELSALSNGRASERPDAGEWSVKEVVGHLCDFERVFAYRAMHFARGSGLVLQTFDQDLFVSASGANERTLVGLLTEFLAVRAGTLAMFGGLTSEMLTRCGVASGAEMSARAVPYVIAGHEAGHFADQTRIHHLGQLD